MESCVPSYGRIATPYIHMHVMQDSRHDIISILNTYQTEKDSPTAPVSLSDSFCLTLNSTSVWVSHSGRLTCPSAVCLCTPRPWTQLALSLSSVGLSGSVLPSSVSGVSDRVLSLSVWQTFSALSVWQSSWNLDNLKLDNLSGPSWMIGLAAWRECLQSPQDCCPSSICLDRDSLSLSSYILNFHMSLKSDYYLLLTQASFSEISSCLENVCLSLYLICLSGHSHVLDMLSDLSLKNIHIFTFSSQILTFVT